MNYMKDFSELPKEIDFTSYNTHWYWGRGGKGLKDHQYHIDYIHDNILDEDIYVLPEYINDMIRLSKKWAIEEKIREIKNVLEID